MLPYLAFAGPVTVMMALLNAQGRFALTAFSPLLFNIALIARHDRAARAGRDDGMRAALIDRRNRRHRRPAAIADAGAASGDGASRRRLRISFDDADARLSRQGDPGHDRERGAAIADRRRRDHRLVSPSAVSWLYFANRLIELPLGIVGVAMGTVLVPELTRALQRQ